MRIGIFTDSYYPHISGVSTSVEMLKNALEKSGHRVYIVAPNLYNNRLIYDKFNGIIWLPGVKTGIYNTKFTKIYSRRAMYIIKIEWKLDVIHSQTEFGVGIFSRKVSRKLKIPIVHTYHTLYEDYVHYLSHGKFNKTFKMLAIKLTKYFCDKKCDELIVPSNKIRRLFKQKYNVKRTIHVIPTGIDLDKFYPNKRKIEKVQYLKRKYKIKDKDFVIGTVGRIAKEKSFDKIIKNVNDLIKENENIKLMIIGDGPEIDNLKIMVNNYKIDKNVIFTGLIDYELIEPYYQVFDIMVSYSKTETQGLTIIEGLASGKPVVCINDQSFKDMVIDNYNGFLFNNDDEFKKYVTKLIKDGYLYEQMCKNAQKSAYSYSKEEFANRVLKIYNLAIKKREKKKIK